jgi:hypothetical protein
MGIMCMNSNPCSSIFTTLKGTGNIIRFRRIPRSKKPREINIIRRLDLMPQKGQENYEQHNLF